MGGGIGEDGGDGGGELRVGNDAAGWPSRTMVAGPPSGVTMAGTPLAESFKDDVAEGVGVRGKDEQVHAGVGRGEGFALEDAGELGAGQTLAQPVLLCAVADDEEAEAAMAGGSSSCCTWARRATFFSIDRRPTKPRT